MPFGYLLNGSAWTLQTTTNRKPLQTTEASYAPISSTQIIPIPSSDALPTSVPNGKPLGIPTQTVSCTKYHPNFSIFHPCINHTLEKAK